MPISEVYNEDCFETLKRIEAGSVGLLLQDTPFGCTQNEWDIKPDLEKMWPEWLRVCRKNAAMIFFATQPFASELITSQPKLFRYDLIWYKQLGSGFLNAKKMPLRNHEHLLVFYRALPVYNPQMRVGKKKTKGRKEPKERSKNFNYGGFKDLGLHTNEVYYPESVLDFTNGDRTTESQHPTQKPLDLIRYLIRTYSNPDDLVFDGYLGSGTTMVAAHMEGRNFIGSEMKLDYYNDIQERFKEQTAQIQLF